MVFRYYYLLDSYSKLMEACMDVGASCDKWLSRVKHKYLNQHLISQLCFEIIKKYIFYKVTISSWLTHIKEILNCGCLIAQVLDKVKRLEKPCCPFTIKNQFFNV